MPENPVDERLIEILRTQLRQQGRANIRAWLDLLDSGDGHILILKAATTGHAIIETGFQSGNFTRLL